jgi:hypothetical protein
MSQIPNQIHIFGKEYPVDMFIDNDNQPIAFTVSNDTDTFTCLPYIFNGDLYSTKGWYMYKITEKIFSLKEEIYKNTDDRLSDIYTPIRYQYDFNVIRQILLDKQNNIIADTGAVRLFDKENNKTDIMKLNHRWYTPIDKRDLYIRNRKILNIAGQSHVKQQWLVGITDNVGIMYEVREFSNTLWKKYFKNEGEFFNEENGWFYTEEPLMINGFLGYALIWYDKSKYMVSDVLECLNNL